MRIHVVSGNARRKPQAGDTKTVRGVEMIRQQQRATAGPHKGAYIVSNGRPVWEWVPKGSELDRTAKRAEHAKGGG